jgi:hypothetical protein
MTETTATVNTKGNAHPVYIKEIPLRLFLSPQFIRNPATRKTTASTA